MTYTDDFLWGAATAAYQVEGSPAGDGRGRCVWDAFCADPGRVKRGEDARVACDHYRRYREDVALMRHLGLDAYRLSISWPRILPGGTGRVNAAGLDFYDRLVDELLAAGIRPFATFFHWDFPLALMDRGGWLARESADWFAAYAGIVARRLGDRVADWMTLNEPQCFVGLGHQEGVNAPGLTLGIGDVLAVTHHVLLAHGAAVDALRAASPAPCRVGLALVGHPFLPATDDPADVAAARKHTFSSWGRSIWSTAWWLDPMIRGRYPADGLAKFAATPPPVREGDLERIARPLDFIGVNCYVPQGMVRAGDDGTPVEVPLPADIGRTMLGWPVVPEALYWSTRFLHERYGLPLVVTENGIACPDAVGPDGRVDDAARIDFTGSYLRQLARAMAEGVDVRGYFHWSLLDNFEWAEGYAPRFGLVHVDPATGRRTPKRSATWYAHVIATRGASLDEPGPVATPPA